MRLLENKPETLKHKTVFGIAHEFIIAVADHRQKWIDPSQSVTLFLATPDIQGVSARSNLNRPSRRAWDKSLKTTYYPRTLQASNIEKSTIDVKKAARGLMGATPEPKTFTTEEKNACSLEAMMNGGTCEACQ